VDERGYFYDFAVLLMVIIALWFAINRRREAAVLFAYIAGAAYLLQYYFGFQTPLVSYISGLIKQAPPSEVPTHVEIPWFSTPFNNVVLDTLYLIGIHLYAFIMTIAIIFTSMIRKIIEFIKSLISK